MQRSITSQNRQRSTTGLAHRLTGLAHGIGQIYIWGLLGLAVQHRFFPQRTGFLGLTQVFAPYLFIPLLLALPLVLYRRSRSALLGLTACLIVGAVRFLPIWISFSPSETPDAQRFSAATWNLLASNRDLDELRQTVLSAQADILAVQELTWQQSTLFSNDPQLQQRYPWQYLQPGDADGIGILSRFPILEHGVLRNPARPEAFPTLWARIDPGSGQTLMVVTVHPRAPGVPIDMPLPFPRAFRTAGRDADIRYLRDFIEPFLQKNEPLLLLGDFNLTERESAYREASAGLLDAHLEVGSGSGHTWIVAPLRHVDMGLLRIDYLFSSPRVKPLRTSVNCAVSGSDHCLVRGVFEMH